VAAWRLRAHIVFLFWFLLLLAQKKRQWWEDHNNNRVKRNLFIIHETTFEVITLVYVCLFVDAFGVFCFFKNQWEGFSSGREDLGSKNWEDHGAKMNTNVHLICILQSGIMLKGQEKQQQVIKNSKKCFVFFFIYVYDVLFLLQWFTVWFLLRSRYLFNVFVIILFLIYIYQMKKGTFVVLYLCSRGLFLRTWIII